MIAEAMVVSGLGPEAFGVEPSAALGEEVLSVLQEQNAPEPDPFEETRARSAELIRQHG